jgi:hypothetical protein
VAETIPTFQSLHSRRTMAAYGVVGTAQVAVAYLQLGETKKAIDLLLGAISDYQVANQLVEAQSSAILRPEVRRG